MKRRNMLAGLAAVTAGAGAVGTGAFTSVNADRDASVSVANDSQAFLTIFPNNQIDNGAFAVENSLGRIEFDFNNEIPSQDSTGVGQNSVYEFDAVFGVENGGSQDVFVDITPNPLTIDGYPGSGNGEAVLDFYINDGGNRVNIDGSSAELLLPVGTRRAVGVRITTSEADEFDQVDFPDTNESAGKDATIHADTTEDSSNGIDPGSSAELTKP